MIEKKIGNVKSFVILLAITLVAIALRLYCFHGFVGLDDAEYARFAHQMAKGAFTVRTYGGPAVFPLRVGIIFPTSLLFRFFGVSEWSMVFYSFLLSFLCLFLAYICGTYLFNRRAGLFAAFIWAVIPIEIQNATKLLPDLPAAFYASLGVTSILFTMRSRIQKKLTLFIVGFLAGLSFGLSWLCKETVVYLVPFCFVWLLITMKRDWHRNALVWLGVAVGSLGILSVEMVTYHNIMGDWLFRFHEIERNYGQLQDGFFSEGSRWGWPVGGSYALALMKRLFLTGPTTILFNSQFLFIPVLGLVGCFYAFYWKDKNFAVPSLWLISLLLMFNFSSSSFSTYAPLALFERYLYPIFFPAILLVAGLVGKLLDDKNRYVEISRERHFWGILFVSFLVVIGGYQVFRSIRDVNSIKAWTSEVKVVSKLVRPSEKIYTDAISKKGLDFFWRYPEKMKTINFEGMKSSEDINARSFVLINRRYADWLDTNSGMWLSKSSSYKKPAFFKDPPESWETIWKNNNATLYHIE